MSRHPRRITALAVALSIALPALGACARHDVTGPDGVPRVPCGARLGRVPGSTVPFVGMVYNAGYLPRLEWSADGTTLFVNGATWVPCVGARRRARGAARDPVRRRDLGRRADRRRARGTPRPLATGVDSGARVLAFVAPGVRLSTRDVLPDTLVTIDLSTHARRAVTPLDPPLGATVTAMAPDGSAVIAGGIDLLVPVGLDAFDVVRVPEGTRARVARLRGPAPPGAFDWRPDGTLLAWEERVDEEPWRAAGQPPDDGLAHVVAAVRRFAPGDTLGTEVLRGTLAVVPSQLRVSPDGRRAAQATDTFVAVAPLP